MSFDINSELIALGTFEKSNDEMKYIIDSVSLLYLKIVIYFANTWILLEYEELNAERQCSISSCNFLKEAKLDSIN